MPNQPATPLRNIRIPNVLWADMKYIAAEERAEGGVSEITRECYEKRRDAFVEKYGPIDRDSAEYRAAQATRRGR